MLRCVLALAIGVAALSLSTVGAADEKEKKGKDGTTKLEGKLVCSKCTLKETPKCGHALKVKDGDKEVTYYLKDKGAQEKYHKEVCPADSEKDVVVTGKVAEKDGKKWITDAKVEDKK